MLTLVMPAGPVFAVISSGVCQIGSTSYPTLDEALAIVQDGETITLLQNINYNSGISVSGKTITFGLNGHKLDVTNTGGPGLEVGSDGKVYTSGSGQFDVTGSTYGVYAHDGGLVTVTGAGSTAAGSTGVKALSGGVITVTGDIDGLGGAYASGNGSEIIVDGNITASDSNASGAWVTSGGKITVGQDVHGSIYGVHAYGTTSSINVGGDVVSVSSSGTGATAESGANIKLEGNVRGAYGVTALYSNAIVHVAGDVKGTAEAGAWAVGGAKINIDGNAEGISGGARATGAFVKIGGNATATGLMSAGALAENGGDIAVGGNASGTGSAGIGISALSDSNITVAGYAQGNYNGVNAQSNSTVFVAGTVYSGGYGVIARSGGEVTIDGVISVGSGSSIATSGNCNIITPTTKPGYVTYSDGESTVWVKDASVSEAMTFVLSNEEGGLIDQLIDAGYGDNNLYEVLQVLQPLSGGAIPADFMTKLAACPSGCDAKTNALSNCSSELNNPVCVGADGEVIIAQIHGRDYYGDAGYTTTSGNLVGVGNMLFTAADSDVYYIDAGSLVFGDDTTYYKAFSIAWVPANATLTGISLTPANVGITKGETKQMIVTAAYSDGTTVDVTAESKFSFAEEGIAGISATGLLTAEKTGSTVLTAGYEGFTGTSAIKVRSSGGGGGGGTTVDDSDHSDVTAPAFTLTRLAGADRYGTAGAISSNGWSGTSDTVILCSGENFPDALAGVTL